MHHIPYFTRSIVFLAALAFVTATAAQATDEAQTSTEQELLGILRSDAHPSEKAIACKKLAIHGTSEAVPDLAKLLPDPQLSSWARIALEAIPGTASDEALRAAAASLEGRLLVGMINSIGVRRDAGAVAALAGRLEDSDAAVASAAAVALGHIGNPEAVDSLRKALATAPDDVRSAVAEGCVLCAERLQAEGNAAEAIAIYDEVRSAEVPTQRIIEATRGAILARNQDGIPILLEQFRSDEKVMFQLALGTAREFPGSEIDQVLANELAKVAPERAALLVQAMADRPETVVLSAVLKAAESGPRPVRLSAIDALKRVGDDSCLPALLMTATEADAEMSQTAKTTLAELPGDRVDSQIVALLANADQDVYPVLIELVGKRRIDAVPQLLTALEHRDEDIRSAALIALGETVALKRLPILISQVIDPRHPEDADTAQQALKAASIRMPDREACAAALTDALEQAQGDTKSTILEILADVGGTTALETLAVASKSDDPQLQDTGSRLLGKWNSVNAAPVLLDLAKTAPQEKYQVRALRGYIGLVRKFAMPDQQRAEMCRNALDAAQRTDERKLVLDVLALHPSIETLGVAVELAERPEIKSEATQTIMAIAQKLGGKGVDMTELLANAGLDKVDLEIVKAEYGAGETQKDVTDVLRKRAGDRPVITLVSQSYNTSFGGDPAPGTVKKLKVQYRINGKTGEASFDENDLIILPMPK